MSRAHSISSRRAYGLQRVCRVWDRARSSVYARRRATRSPVRLRRPGPVGAAPDEVLVGHIRRVLEASPFHGEGYRKAWAKLRFEGIRTSKERVRRLMREHGLQAPHRVGHPHGPRAHDGTITTEAPDVMWGTDMTSTVTVGEGSAFVFVAVDHCTTECIGLHAAKSGSRFGGPGADPSGCPGTTDPPYEPMPWVATRPSCLPSGRQLGLDGVQRTRRPPAREVGLLRMSSIGTGSVLVPRRVLLAEAGRLLENHGVTPHLMESSLP